MQTITTDTTVGEIVRAAPARSRIFEKLGIDYCCGGKKPLSEACVAKGLDPATIVAMLSALDDVADTRQADVDLMSLSELCDHISSTHHGHLRGELPRLDFMTRKVAAVHGDHEPRLAEIRREFQGFLALVAPHIEQEDNEIFPEIKKLDAAANGGSGASFDGLLEKLEHEHEDTGKALAKLKELTDDYTPPEWACNTFRALYDALSELEKETHQHIHKENNVLFPKVKARVKKAA